MATGYRIRAAGAMAQYIPYQEQRYMMAERKVLWGRLLWLLVTVLLAGSAWARDAGYTQGLLWEIRGGGAPSYLFGTIHSEDPRVTRLPDAVQRAFGGADTVVLELDLSAQNVMSMATAMLLSDGSNLRDLLGASLYRRTVAACVDYGLPEPMVMMMKPWAAATTLMMPKSDTGRFLDLILYQSATEQGKTVQGLETADEQMAVFDGLPLRLQIGMLRDALDQQGEMEAFFERLHLAYLSRDLQRLVALNQETMSTSDPELVRMMDTNLVVERNHRMAQRMESYLRHGKAFVAVGALHLPGEEGILQLLARRGYRLRALY